MPDHWQVREGNPNGSDGDLCRIMVDGGRVRRNTEGRKETAMQRTLISCLLVCATAAPLVAQEAKPAGPPRWDASGLGPLPRMGISSLDVSDDGEEIVVGTIAAFGDPNVIVLNDAGKILRQYRVGQQWIDRVAFLPGSKDVLAVCTMPAGRAGDRVEAFLLKGDQVIPEKTSQEGPWFFHYGDHSNHPTMQLARAPGATALLAGNQLVIHRKGKEARTLRVPVNDPDASLSLAVDEAGWAVVGTTAHSATAGTNLYLFDPDGQKPVWSRPVNREVAKAPAPEKGLYGTPTLPDGSRAELPQRDEMVWAPLAVAIHGAGPKKRIAVADYQGWQRWVRSSATMRDDNQGLRFMPAKPTVTVYDETGKTIQRFAADQFKRPVGGRSLVTDFDRPFTELFWCDLKFSADGARLFAWSHHWRSRGLAGQPMLPADETNMFCALGIADGVVNSSKGASIVCDVALSDKGNAALCKWNNEFAMGKEEDLWGGLMLRGPRLGRGPCLLHFLPGSEKVIMAYTDGNVHCLGDGRSQWHVDLNQAVAKSPKPWVANARATPIVPGGWQLPGGRVESDLGGQRLIEAPDGYILIEGHAGLSFEREWAAMEAVGLDPRKVKYVLATHEHGDHAPGAYLWRVVTGAKFVCSEEMAYTLQHHIPGNTGYGLHPPIPTDIRVAKDAELDLAGLKVRALRIPGHTFGSMAWHFEKSGKTFVAFGDLIMPRGVLGYSGSVNFSASDVLASLRKLDGLKVDYVLPGHGAVEGPGNYFRAGIDVGTAVGWGFIKPERPDPRFRLTQKNVLVVGWGQQATSAAFGDVDGDGKPDVVIVSPEGEGSVVKFFLNHGGKFNDRPDHEIKLPHMSQPHKIRITTTKAGPHILVAGKTAAVLVPDGKFPSFSRVDVDLGDANHLRFLDDGTPLIARRFGGFFALGSLKEAGHPRKATLAIDGPYCDFRQFGNDLLTSYGQLYRRADGKFPEAPTLQLPCDKDWTFLAVGDFNGDGKPDAALLSYGMDKATSARVFYGKSPTELMFGEKQDAVIPLSALLTSAKRNQTFPLVRDTPVVADWNGDGIDDLVVAHGQSDEVLVLLGGKDGLRKEPVVRIPLEYRVHYEHGVHVADFNGDGKPDLAVFGYTNTGVGAGGPPAVYVWLQ
jgi:metallo-beta-lactamase class B